MSIRLNCQSCRTAFVTSDEHAGRKVACPKCGTPQRVPSTAIVTSTAPDPAPLAESVFVPASEAPRGKKRRPILWAFLILIPLAAVAVVIAWPRVEAWWHPVPPDPIEVAASGFLKALVEENEEDARRLSTIEDPPAIRSFRAVQHHRKNDKILKGTFRPIAKLHARITEKYEYLPESGRFKIRDELGAAAEVLDTLHDAKAKAEQDELYKKMQSGDPNDLFDAAEKFGGAFTKMAEKVLAPKKLVPTYKQLVLDAKPTLPPNERTLALDYATNREIWDALLKRPFPTLKSDGPFVLDRAEVSTLVADKLASSGDPPTRLHLKLLRFRLEGIDTRWRVISARREGEPEPHAEPVEEPPPAERPKVSPGEATHP